MKGNSVVSYILDENAADVENMECLTPPCSSESTCEQFPCKDMGSKHAKFLKSSTLFYSMLLILQNIILLQMSIQLRLNVHVSYQECYFVFLINIFTVVSVWNARRSAAILKDTEFSFHLLTTVLQAVTGKQQILPKRVI